MENSTRALCSGLYKYCKLKVKVWWVGGCKRKGCIFCNVYFVQRKLFNILDLSHCIVYWINFQNRYVSTYQKVLVDVIFCFFFKSWKTVSVSLNRLRKYVVKKPIGFISKKLSWFFISDGLKFFKLEMKIRNLKIFQFIYQN